MRLFLVPLIALAACASTSPKDLEKMSALDVCYMSKVDPDKRALADAEISRRNINCDGYEAQMKKMEEQEMRAGGMGPQGADAAKASGYNPGSSGGGMGRY